MEPRLVELEIRYSHLEKQLAELNQVVFEQQQAIGVLRDQVVALRGRMGAQDEPMPIEKPPHY